jgi:transposase
MVKARLGLPGFLTYHRGKSPHIAVGLRPMRSKDQERSSMWTTLQPEQTVPENHPLRPIRSMVNEILSELSPEFARLYSKRGRPSIPPEKLLRALLLQILFSIRSEPMLLEQLRYNLLFRWFVGLSMDDPVWDVSTFSKNRKRFLEGEISRQFFEAVVGRARGANLLSDEHFTVDGTLIEAWASHKNFRPKDGRGDGGSGSEGRNAEADFKGEKRRNDTHASTTDSDARLYRKGRTGAVLGYLGHALMENRNGLIVDVHTTHANGFAEREAALKMLARLPGGSGRTVGADKGYDTTNWVNGVRALGITPHVAQNVKHYGGSAIDGRTTRHEGYRFSQRRRKLIEESFGWGKTVGTLRKVHFRGLELVGDVQCWVAIAYNLVRMRNLGVVT